MWIGTMRCDFIKFTDTSTDTDPVSLQFGRKWWGYSIYQRWIFICYTYKPCYFYILTNPVISGAVWRYQGWSWLASGGGLYVFESCLYYPEEQEIDATWKTAQAFAIITFIWGFFVMIASCVFGCAQGENGPANVSTARAWVAPNYLLLTIFQGLTLLLLNSNACNDNFLVEEANDTNPAEFPETCSLNTGANLIISATVLWFAAALASFSSARAAKQESGGEADADVELADKAEAAEAETGEEAAKEAEAE